MTNRRYCEEEYTIRAEALIKITEICATRAKALIIHDEISEPSLQARVGGNVRDIEAMLQLVQYVGEIIQPERAQSDP